MSANSAITARLGLDAGEFRKDLQATTKAVEAEERKMAAAAARSAKERAEAHTAAIGKVKSAASELAAAAGLSLGLAGLAAAGKDILDFAGNLQDSSDALGINVEAMQELNAAFAQSGANTETVNKGLAKLGENLTNAKNGDEKLIASFAALGVTWREINTLAPDEIIMRIAASAGTANDPADRLSKIIDVMGKSGLKMAAGLNSGADALSELRNQTSKLNTDEVKALDDVGDALGRLWLKTKVFGAKGIMAIIDPGSQVKPPEAGASEGQSKNYQGAAFMGQGGMRPSPAVQPSKEPPLQARDTGEFFGPNQPDSGTVEPGKRKRIEEEAKLAINALLSTRAMEEKNADAALDRDAEVADKKEKRARLLLGIQEQVAKLEADRAQVAAAAEAAGDARANARLQAEVKKGFDRKLADISDPQGRAERRRAERKQSSLDRRAARELDLEARKGIARQDFRGDVRKADLAPGAQARADFKQALDESNVLKAIETAIGSIGKAKGP